MKARNGYSTPSLHDVEFDTNVILFSSSGDVKFVDDEGEGYYDDDPDISLGRKSQTDSIFPDDIWSSKSPSSQKLY